jgi:uncharacterized protein (TIGR04255 family)
MSLASYKVPPIKEAVFDIKFVFENQPELGAFEDLYNHFSVTYPKKETLNQQFVSFKIGDPTEPDKFESTGGTNGIRLTSVDGLHIVQFRPDGITFSRLEPYNGWDSFSAEAETMITTYVKLLKPSYISRLALRFINVIKIPETNFEISDYFNTEPRLADIQAGVLSFFMRQVIQNKTGEVFAIINQATTDKVLGETLTQIVFDIDVFKENIKIQLGSDEYKSLLSKLRDFRTEIFEKSLTEKTKQLFNL